MDDLEAEVERNVDAWRARIAELPGKHVAIEALWDGDTNGWFVGVALVTASARRWWQPRPPGEGKFSAHPLATLRYGGDIRLFNGQVPPWPEAIVAKRAGAKVASDLGLEFYFPSPDHPDDDCAEWWERDRATRCRTCGKPLKRHRGSRSLATVQCHPCELEEERRHALMSDAPGHRGNRAVYFVREEGGSPAEGMFLNLSHPHSPGMDERLSSLLRARVPPLELSENVDTTLTPADVEAMRAWCAQAIDERLGTYTVRAEFPDHVTYPHSFSWRGVERTVQRQFNPAGAEIASLHRCHDFFERCAATGAHLFGNGGVTQRDASVLAMARARARTAADFRTAFPFLSPEAIEQTLTKLERRRFLARDGDAVRLLLKGRFVDLAGP